MPTENENQSEQVSGVPPPTACSLCSGRGWLLLSGAYHLDKYMAIINPKIICPYCEEKQNHNKANK